MIDSAHLSSFIAFAEELNFTRAAARLHISQPALHVQVAKLAESLGVALYRRQGRGLELTPQGNDVLAFARELRDRSDAFLATLSKSRATQRVVIAAGEGTLLYLLADPIRRLSTERRVRVRVLTRDREGTIEAVMSGAAHMGVAPLEANPDGLDVITLGQIGFQVVFPRGHRLAAKRRVRLRDLAGERLILPPAERPHRQHISRALAAEGLECEVALEASGWELMLEFARLGIGTAIVNTMCRVPRGAIARPLGDLTPLRYCLLHRAGVPPLPAAKELRDLVVQAFRR